jgi:thioredoxin-dependent peroxiredoxin
MAETIKDFELVATGGSSFRLSEHRGKTVVLYFYPKDDTPGCTLEGQEFRDLYTKFQDANALVAGISRDSVKSHESFKGKHVFPFPLLSDPDETVCKQFGVMKLKNMYGKQVRGIERSTFVINAKGELAREWRGVKAPGHAAEVLAFVATL